MTSVRRPRLAFARIGLAGFLAALLLPALGSGEAAAAKNPLKLPDTQYEPVAWAQIEGWADDDHNAAFETFLKSCQAILQGSADSRQGRPMHAALFKVCQRAVEAKPQKPGEARAFFEQNFRPIRISPLGTPDGFVTGYYEPIVEGTRSKGDGYDYPLYRKPSNLLPGGRMAVAGAPAEGDGKKKKRHGPRRKLVSFYDRTAIDDGVLAGRNLEICWLKDPIDSFFIHIQGSVRVVLDDGKLMRLNYEAANGHPYYAVGRWLIDRKIVPKDEMSMDRIREWMERNPKEGEELRRRNKSYVFFRETRLPADEEPIGAEGISLTPGRSIAVDHKLHTYGTPFFISAYLPIQSLKPDTWFRRLMIAQDTGGAIVGPARADLYFGAGDEAASVAGRLRHDGRFVMLAPKELVPSTGDEIPLPPRRPTLEQMAEYAKTVAKDEAAGEGKSEPEIKAGVVSELKPAGATTARPAHKPSAKVAARSPEPELKKTAAATSKAERAAAKKTDKKADKPPKQKPEKREASAKPAPSKVKAWEARVMPVIASEPAAATRKSKKK
jgi:membrane-bound lytic murein transglycosylase A